MRVFLASSQTVWWILFIFFVQAFLCNGLMLGEYGHCSLKWAPKQKMVVTILISFGNLCGCLPKQKCIVEKFRKAMVCALGIQMWNLYFVWNLFYWWEKFRCWLLFGNQPWFISKVTAWVIYQKCMYSIYWFFILFKGNVCGVTWQNQRYFELQQLKKNKKF